MRSEAGIKKSASRITNYLVRIAGLASQRIYTPCHTHTKNSEEPREAKRSPNSPACPSFYHNRSLPKMLISPRKASSPNRLCGILVNSCKNATELFRAQKRMAYRFSSYRLNLQALMTLMAFSSSSLRLSFIFLSLASLMISLSSVLALPATRRNPGFMTLEPGEVAEHVLFGSWHYIIKVAVFTIFISHTLNLLSSTTRFT
jgi:hypothetical protein